MDRSVVAFVEGIVTLVVFAGIGFTGFWIWSRTRIRHQPDMDRLLDAIRDDNSQLHADLSARLAELEERLDFTERRLVQERNQAQPPSVRIPTPV
jgi:hypothetical protein